MSDQARKILPINQILALLLVALVVYLAVDFGRQVGISRQRREELRRLEQDIQTTQAEAQELAEQYQYATSPRAAEEWALHNGLGRPGETLVMFVGSTTAAAPAMDRTVKENAPRSPREAWWDLFFGTR